jgi:hypothetical protein
VYFLHACELPSPDCSRAWVNFARVCGQIFAQNWWTKREYRAVYGDADAIRIVKKPLKFVYQLMTKALSGVIAHSCECICIHTNRLASHGHRVMQSADKRESLSACTSSLRACSDIGYLGVSFCVGPSSPPFHPQTPRPFLPFLAGQESKSASVSCSVVAGPSSDKMALLVSVIVRSEFDESTYDFKLPDVTTVADGSRLQDMILDLRCVLYALTDSRVASARLCGLR